MKKFKEILIDEIEISELDLEYPFFNEDENPNNIDFSSGRDYYEVVSIDIDRVINLLTEFKDKGANRVYIDTHIDHQAYKFCGVNLVEENPKSLLDIIDSLSPEFKTLSENYNDYTLGFTEACSLFKTKLEELSKIINK